MLHFSRKAELYGVVARHCACREAERLGEFTQPPSFLGGVRKGGIRLTEDVDAANLLLHLLRVDLAHVAPAVRLLNLTNLELPDPAVIGS